MVELTEWTGGDAGRLTELAAAALAAEDLTEDELASCIWDDPDEGVTLAFPGGEGGVALVLRSQGTESQATEPTAFFKFLAVRPDAQRRGHGRELVAAAEEWARGHGASGIVVGASAPFYLWPGVDFRATAALCLFEATGYRPVGAEFNMGCPATFRADPPDGVAVERVLDDAAVRATVAFCTERFPNWVPEVGRGVEQGGGFRAVVEATGATVGFACHSVNRMGWIGPMGTDPAARRRGVGAALLAALCRDINATGRLVAEVAWVGPAGFYANTAGATVSRVFRRLRKNLR